jgi:hypothetical protein
MLIVPNDAIAEFDVCERFEDWIENCVQWNYFAAVNMIAYLPTDAAARCSYANDLFNHGRLLM